MPTIPQDNLIHSLENRDIPDSVADDGVRFELLSGILAILAGKRGFLGEL